MLKAIYSTRSLSRGMQRWLMILCLTLTGILANFESNSQCLTANGGQYPSTTYTPLGTFSFEPIVTNAYAGEYTLVQLTGGVQYQFQSSVSTDVITISDAAGATALVFGAGIQSFTPTTSAVYRFYAHLAGCLDESIDRTKSIRVVPSPCTVPGGQPTSLVLTPTGGAVTGTFTAPTATPLPTNYLVVRYPAGGTETIPVDGTTYTVGATLGAGTVAAISALTTFTASGLTSSTSYDFYIYSYRQGSCVTSYLTSGALFGSATTTTPVAPACPSAFTPVNNAVNQSVTPTITWTASSGDPTPTYDVYFSSSQTNVTLMSASARVLTNTSATSYSPPGLSYSTAYYYKIVPKNALATITTCAVNKFTTQSPQAPDCATTYTPANSATGVSISTSLSWSGAVGNPGIIGYDVYLSTDQNAVTTNQVAARVGFGISSTTFVPTSNLLGNTTYYWKVVPVNNVGRSSSCPVVSFTTSAPLFKTAVIGGNWSSPRTWGGTTAADLPAANDNVTIPDGVIITVDQNVAVNDLTIGQGGSASSVLQWGTGSFSLTASGNVTISSNGRFHPYTAAASPAGQTVNIGGNLTNNGYANFAVSGTLLNFNGSQVTGGSLSQTISGGANAFQGNGTDAIIANLQIGTTGTVTVSTSQVLVVTTALNDLAGTFASNNLVRVDNTAIVHGLAFNQQVASVSVTNMGTTAYSAAPSVAPASAANWATGAVSAGAVRVNAGNVYVAIAGGTATTAPTHTTGVALDGGLQWLYVGPTGTIGNAFAGTSLTPTAGTQYFLGGNLFTCVTAAAMTTTNINNALSTLTAATPGTLVTVGTATFLCVGTPATVSVNFDATSGLVRGLNLVSAGSGYITTAPAMVILAPQGGTGAGATAVAVMFQSIQGNASSTMTKSPSAVLGSLNIRNGVASGFTGVGSVYVTNGGLNYTAAPTVGFSLPTGINLIATQGVGYTSTPTVAITGGGGSGATATAVMAQGRVVSVYITNAGTGYTSWPSISLTGGGFTTAATISATLSTALPLATANINSSTRQLSSITVTNAGWGYLPGTAPTVTLAGGTVTTAATGATARVFSYNLTYNVVAPSTASPVVTPGNEMPTDNKVSQLVLGSNVAAGFVRINLANDLDVMQTITLSTSAVTSPTVLNLQGKKLTFSNPTYSGSTGTVFGYVTNGEIVANSPGLNNARSFPFDGTVVVTPGGAGQQFVLSCTSTASSPTVSTFASVANVTPGMTLALAANGVPAGSFVTAVTTGTPNTITFSANATSASTAAFVFTNTGLSNITQITVSRFSNPTGTIVGAGGTAIGNRGYRVQANGVLGATGTIQLNFNTLDTFALAPQQTAFYIGQASSTTGPWTIKTTTQGILNAVIAPTTTNTARTTVSTVPGLPTPVDLSQGQYFSWVESAPSTSLSTTATGGIWSDPATWANNIVPSFNDDAVIADGAIVTVDVATNVRSLTIGGNGTGARLQWSGSSAMTVRQNLTVNAGATFLPHSSNATAPNVPAAVTLNIGGNFTMNGTANLGFATLNFTGSTLPNGSLTQTFSGNGTLVGDTITGGRGLIRTLQLASVGGSLTIGWTGTQRLVANNMNLFAGQLITGNKLVIDNTAASYGQLYNRSLTSVAITNQGAGYSQAPVVFGVAISAFIPSTAVTVGAYIHTGTNVYQCTAAGTVAATAPSSTAATTFTSGTATLLYIGEIGSVGQPFSATATSKTIGQQYFYGNNLYVATATTNTSTPPTHTNTTVVNSFRYVGTVAKVAVNFNSTTRNVRSLSITQAGNGYLGGTTPSTVPSIVFSQGGPGASSGIAATATAVVVPIVGVTTNATVSRSTGTSISGPIDIRSTQGVGNVSVAYGGVYTARPNLGFSLPTNFLNLVTNQGSGYSGTLTFTEVGAVRVAGGGTAATYSGVIANGRIVSVRCTGGGTGYLVAPTSLTIAGTTGSGATAAFPANALATGRVVFGGDSTNTSGVITDVIIYNAGSGYDAVPTATLDNTAANFLSAASGLTARLQLYNLTYAVSAPSTLVSSITESSEIPANRRMNSFTMNNASGAVFTNDLELYASSPLTLTSGIMNFASGKALTFSHQNYRGVASSATSFVNAEIQATTPGGSLTQIFPLEAAFSVITGTGADATTGSTVTSLRISTLGAPSGSNGPKGTRSYRVVTNTGALFGVEPRVTMSWTAADGLTGNAADYYIGQSTALNGPTWTKRSVASGGSVAIPATGSRTSGTVAAPPVIVPTGDDYYAWISPVPAITNVTVPAGGNCTATAQNISADIDFLSPATAAANNPVTLTYTFTTSGVAVGPTSVQMLPSTGNTWTGTIPAAPAANSIVTWSIKAINSVPDSTTFIGTTYSDSAFSAANSVTVTSSKSSLCGSGGTVILSATSNDPNISYVWNALGNAALSSITGSSTTATLTETTDFEVVASSGGCSTRRIVSIGVYPFPSSTPTATPNSICIGGTTTINSGLSASNFSASCIIPPTSLAVPPAGITPTILLNQTTLFSFSTTNGSNVVTVGSSFNLYVGTNISGTGIPAGTTITEIISPTQIRISNNATATGSVTNGTINRSGPNTMTSFDDAVVNGLPIGFTYNFFGTNYTTFSPSTNATVIIGGAGNTAYSFPNGFPSPASPLNCVALGGRDLNMGNQLGVPASILYWTEGTAPNRKMILQYINCATWHTTSANDGYSTIEGVFYETTGNVEIRAFALVNPSFCFGTPCTFPNGSAATYIGDVRRKVIGVNNSTGLIGATAPNCANDQAGYWNARQDSIPAGTPQAWRFVPPHPYSVSYTSSNGAFSSASSGADLFSTTAVPSTIGIANYTITYTDGVTGCNNITSPATVAVNVVSQPITPIITSPINVCGAQAVTLSITNNASVPANSRVRWYDAAVGGNLLAEGASFTSGTLSSSTTFYVAIENTSCSSARVPVQVNITQPPALTVSSPIVCGVSGVQITPISVTSAAGNYDTYTWSPITNLYQDAAGTIQYTGQNLTTVYVKTTNVYTAQSSTPSVYNYTVRSYDFSSGCSNLQSSSLTIQPPAGVAKITSSVPFICVSASATLTMTPATSAGSIQWQASTDNINFTDISGANANTYATAVLTDSTYFRVALKDGSGNICSFSDTIFLGVNNPQVTSATGGSVCGGGSVQLTATGAGTLNWYAAQTGGSFFAQGTSVASPAVTVSPTSFWVASSVNGCIGTRTEVIATITSPSTVDVPSMQTICAGGVATIALPNNVDYNSYTWSPVSDIYSNAAATTQITASSNLQTVYIKPTTPGVNTYTVTASKIGVTACQTTATVQVNALPATATTAAFPASICPNGTSTLSVSAGSSLSGAQYQWQISTAGIGGPYTDISGATSATYVTLAANTTQWYRAEIRNGAGVLCITSTPLELSIIDPQLVSTSGAFRCTPGTVVLTASGSAGTSIKWYATSSSTSVLFTGSSFTTPFLSSTTSYWAEAAFGSCASSRTEVFATINTASSVSIATAAQTACNGGTAELTVNANPDYNSFVWSGPAGTLFTDAAGTTAYAGQNLTTVYAKSTTNTNKTYTVTASNASTGCTATATATVRTIPATATVTANPTSICAGGNSNLAISNASLFAGATIQWQSATSLAGPYADITGATGTTYNTGAVSSTSYYQAVVKNTNGTTCFTTNPRTLSVDNPLLLTTTADSACGSSIVILQATASAGATVNWYDQLTGGTLVGTGTSFYTPVLSATTTYYAEAAFGVGCSSTPRVAVTATINTTSASPVSVSANQTICNSGVATLSTPVSVDYDTYVWSPAAGLFNDASATTAYTNGNLLTVYASNATAGSYDYYVTASNSASPGCVSTVKTTVTVLPADGAVTIAQNEDTLCNSGTVTFTISPSVGYGAGTIEWQSSTDNATFTATGSTGATYTTATLTETTYFRAVVKNGSNSCTTSDTLSVTVLTPTVSGVTGAQRCGTGSVTLLATADAGTTLRWYATAVSSTVLATGPAYTTPSLSTNTNYFVAASIGSCVSSAARTQVTATINAPSSVSVSAAATSVCNGGVVALTVAGNADYDTYTWPTGTGRIYQDAGASSLYTGQNLQTVYFKSTTSGALSVTVTASSSIGSCSNTGSVTVNVLPATLTISQGATVCVSGSTTLSFSTTGFSTATFQWETSTTGNSGTFTAISGATGSSYATPVLTSSAFYRVVVTDGGGNSCFTSNQYQVTVSNPTVATSSDGSRCGTGSVTLSATTNTPSAVLNWYATNSNAGTPLSTGATYNTPSISTTTLYYVAAANGTCVGAIFGPVTATVNAAPALSVTAAQTACNNTNAPISVTPDAAYNRYTWAPVAPSVSGTLFNLNNTAYNSALSATSLNARTTNPGNNPYRVTATNTGNGCSATATVNVIVQPSSTALSSIPDAICVTGTADLKLTPSPLTNVTWETSTTGATGSYSAITGATLSTYTTPVITALTYYRAVLKDDAGNTCITSSVKALDISNPSIVSVSNASRCGSGTLTLTASASPGATVYWYTSKTGSANSFVASGNTFTTPALSSTTIYYVSAGIGDCYSERVDSLADTAFVNSAPFLTINQTQTVCNTAIPFQLQVSSDSTQYTDYLWTQSPASPNRLFIDDAGTIAYNSSTYPSAATVYANASTTGSTTYTLAATNSITNCSATTTVTLNVLPSAASAIVTAVPSSICISGNTTLTLAGGPYPTGAIQWQNSSDSITFNNISLANSSQYTTLVQATERYYRVLVKNSNGDACITTPTTTITVNNPQVLSTTSVNRCGPASTVVSATASAGAILTWYPSEFSNTVLATGTSYTTPVIRQTTTYWVAATVGSCSGGRTSVTVTYVEPPALAISSDQRVCSNIIAEVSVTPATLANYTNFSWTSDSALYVDAAATIPYTNQNVSTVYTKGENGFTLVRLTAWDGTAGTPATLTSCLNSVSTLVTFVKVQITSVTSSPAVICEGSNASLTALADAIIGTGPQTAPIGYLPSAATSTADEELLGVSFGTLNNPSSLGQVGPGPGSAAFLYNNYTSLTPPTVTIGQVTNGSVTLGYNNSLSAYSNICNVYFDWNRDGDFADAGESVNIKPYGPLNSLTVPQVFNFSVTIPAFAQPGVTMMRIVFVEATVVNPTGTYTWGETEDYLINVRSFVQPSYDYVWTPGNLTGNTVAAFIPDTAVTYTVTATDPTSGCFGTAQITVTPTAGPSAPTATNATQCGFGIPTATIASTTSATNPVFAWYSAATGVNLVQNGGASYQSPINTTTTFYVAESDGTCFSYPRTPVTVTVTQPDSITAIVDTDTICLGGTINLSAVQTGNNNNYTFTWNGSPASGNGLGVSSTLGAPITLYNNDFTTGVGSATLNGVAAVNNGSLLLNPSATAQLGGITINGNGSSADSLAVTFNMTVTPAGGADGMSYSFGDDVSATATVPNAENGTGTKLKVSFDSYGGTGAGVAGIYIMYNNNTTNPLTTDAGVLAYAANTSWVGATNTAVSIGVDKLGRVTVSLNGTPVTGLTNIQLPAAYLNANKGAWKHVFKSRTGAIAGLHAIDNLNIAFSQFASTTVSGQSVALTPTSAGTYSYVVTATDGSCTTVDTVQVVVNPLPGTVNAGTDRNICSGGTVILTATSSSLPAGTIQWTSIPAGFTSTNAQAAFGPISSNTQFIATVSNGLCTLADTVLVNADTLLPAPTIASSGGVTSICKTGSMTLAITNFNAVSTYQWQTSPSGLPGTWVTIPGEVGSLYGTPVISASTYYRVYGGCLGFNADTSAAYMAEVINPTVLTTTPASRCGTGTLTLGATTDTSGTINWYTALIGGLPVATGNSYTTPSISSTTTYYAEAVAAGQGTFSGLGNTQIPPSTGFNVQRGIQFDAYQSFTLVSSEYYSTTLNITNTVTVELRNSANVVIQTVTIPVVQGSSAGWYLLPLNFNVPAGTGYRLLATFSTSVSAFSTGANYGSAAFNNLAPVGMITAGIESGGTVTTTAYYYFHNLTILSGCASDRVPVVATVTPPPAVTVSGTTTLCSGQSTTLTATSANADYSYSWIPGSVVGPVLTVSPTSTTTYTLTAVDTSGGANNGCSNVITVPVTVNPAPAALTITQTPSVVCGTTPVTLSVAANQSILASVGNGTTALSGSGTSPYSGNWEGAKVQYLYTASQLNAAGITAGLLKSLAFNVSSAVTTAPLNGYTIRLGQTSATGITSFQTGLTQVYTGNITPTAGWNTYTFSAPFTWNGTSNLVIEVCHNNDPDGTCGICYTSTSTVNGTTAPVNSVYGNYGDNADVCSNGGTLATAAILPNIQMNFDPGIAYSWSTGATTSSLTFTPPLGATSYTVTATNFYGCTATATQVVNASLNPKPVITQLVDTLVCFPTVLQIGVADTAAYAGGYPAGTTVQWVGLGITLGANDLIDSDNGSTYQATVTLPSGCAATTSVRTITTRSVTASATQVSPACGATNGSITATIITGTAPYRYVWSQGSTVILDTVTSATSSTISGLAPGGYSLTIDELYGAGGGCSSGVINYTLVSSAPVVVNTTATPILCFGETTSTVAATYTGGSGAVTYNWSTGATTANMVNMGAGTYVVTVSDALGCVGVDTIEVTQPSEIIATITSTSPACAGASTGTLNASTTGGTLGYALASWFFEDPINGPTPLSGDTAESNLAAGTYLWIVQDANQCTLIDTVVLVDPAAVAVNSFTPTSGAVGTSVTINGMSFTGATAVSFNGTAAANFTVVNDSVITATVATGTTTGTISVTVPCGTATSTGTYTVLTNATFNLTAFIEGYYLGAGKMQPVFYNVDGVTADNLSDSIRVELHDPFNTATIVNSQTVVIDTSGHATITLPSSVIGNSFYIAVFSRATIETWSSLPITFSATTSYDFSTASTQAYDDGINLPMKEVETGVWAIYSGDINQDGTVDGADMNDIDNDASSFAFGYNVTDITGDGATDGADMNIVDNNSQLFLFTAKP